MEIDGSNRNSKEVAVERAQTFTGTRNADWEPHIATFDTLKIPNMPFCLVPAGTFQMGSNDGRDSEKPIHSQRVEEAYWIGQYPVTNAQWALGVEAGVVEEPRSKSSLNWYRDRGMLNAPVGGINWYDVQKFAEWMRCRLPTELEWEYAARGVESWQYPWGNEWIEANAVVGANSGKKPRDVTSKAEGKSWIGAYHMGGNVWEWTSSIYADYPYTLASENKQDDSSQRLLRGGSFNDARYDARSSSRYGYDLVSDLNDFGVRLVVAAALRP